MKQFGKILKFELKGYLKNKVFVGITVFLVVAIAVVMFIPNIMSVFESDSADSEKNAKSVMLIYSESPELTASVKESFSQVFSEYDVIAAEGTLDEVKARVVSGEAQCAFAMKSISSYTYYVNDRSMYDTNTVLADSVLQELCRVNAMLDNGLTPEQAGQIMAVGIDGATETLGVDQTDNFIYTFIMIFALYMVILLYGQMVATNVATEKSSRAMEVLITSARPTSMMFGKVLASCLAGFLQLVVVFGTAIILYNVNEEQLENPLMASIFDIPVELFVYMIIFFILGFLIYAFLYGAIGSTASKLEDINTSVMPITFLFIIAFMVVVFSMSSGSVDNLAIKICSYIPFTSPMAMFTRIAMSAVAWYEIVISIAILIISVIGVGVISAKIYRAGVLMYGTPPKLRAIIKAVFK